jgi:hypothetical protein
MYKVNTYNAARTVVFNPAANLRLQSFETEALAASITQIAGQKLVRAGAIICTDGKLLKRARMMNDTFTGGSTIYVNNPWAFSVGDRLKGIANASDSAAQELTGINDIINSPDPNVGFIGEIASIETGVTTQISRISMGVSTTVPGNIITMNFYGLNIIHEITTTSIATEIERLARELSAKLATVENYRYVEVTNTATYIQLESKQPRMVLEFQAILSLGTATVRGALDVAITKGIGAITLVDPLTTNNTRQGVKIGTVNQTPVGIFDTEFDFGDYLNGIAPEQAITPLYGGQFYSKALPYLDGQIIDKLKQANWIPAVL